MRPAPEGPQETRPGVRSHFKAAAPAAQLKRTRDSSNRYDPRTPQALTIIVDSMNRRARNRCAGGAERAVCVDIVELV